MAPNTTYTFRSANGVVLSCFKEVTSNNEYMHCSPAPQAIQELGKKSAPPANSAPAQPVPTGKQAPSMSGAAMPDLYVRNPNTAGKPGIVISDKPLDFKDMAPNTRYYYRASNGQVCECFNEVTSNNHYVSCGLAPPAIQELGKKSAPPANSTTPATKP
jgi:hypothetical protein